MCFQKQICRINKISSAILLRFQNQCLLRRINQAYATPLDNDEIGSIKIIHSFMKKIMESQEWS
jgi:hypothetical protein